MNLIPVVVALVVGIYTAAYINILTAVLSVIAFVLLCYVQKKLGKSNALDMAAAAMMFLVGIFLYHNAMGINVDYVGEYVTVRGVVAELPYESNGINKYVVYCSELEFDGDIKTPKKKILVNSDKSFKCGDSVEVHGKLKELSGDAYSYGFDTRHSFAGRGITAKITALDIHISDTKFKCHRIDYYSNLIRSKAVDLINEYYGGDIAAAVIAIVTGDKHSFSEDYNDVLIYTGMRGLYYPAFLHIAMIISFVGIFSTVIPRRIRDYILVVILFAYALFNSGYAAPTKAAGVVILLVFSKRLFGSGNKINAVLSYIILSIFFNPMLLFSGSFVISAFSTLMLAYMLPIFKLKGNMRKKIVRILILQIGVLPAAAFFFGNIGIYSYLASVIFIPLIGAVIVLSPFMLIGFAVGTPLPFGWIVRKLVLVLLHIPVWISKLPFAGVALPKPSVIFILAFYIGMAGIWYMKRHRSEKARIYAAVSSGLACACLISFFSNSSKLEVNFVDVGQGDATLIHMPFSGNILIDGGGGSAYSEYNIGKNIFVPYLTSRGANVIQAAFVSHYHKDHAEGIVEALKSLKVNNLFLPDAAPEDEWRIKLEEAAEKSGTKVWYVFSPMHIAMEDIDLYVYPPSKSVYMTKDENNSSMMINLCYGEFNCLFTGDMTALGEYSMLSRNLVPKAEVLKVGHHGSADSTMKEFVDAVEPEISLIGCGENNNYRLPRSEALERLKDSRILRTDLNGNISLFVDKKAKIRIKTEK